MRVDLTNPEKFLWKKLKGIDSGFIIQYTGIFWNLLKSPSGGFRGLLRCG